MKTPEGRVACDYCQRPATLLLGSDVYPGLERVAAKKFWTCMRCQAWVGCHPPGVGQGKGTTPLGRLANAELRKAKQRAHAALDTLWQNGSMTRTEAYSWLSATLGLPKSESHIGMFDVGLCERVVEAVSLHLKHAACAARRSQAQGLDAQAGTKA